jgi:hypothetical protein
MFKNIFGIAVLVLSLAARSEAERYHSSDVGIEIIKFGQSERLETGQVSYNSETTNGLTGIGKIKFLSEGKADILAVKGKGMAVTYKVIGKPLSKEIVLEMRTIHPPISNPITGKTGAVSSWFVKSQIGSHSFRDYEFTEQWEIVAGEWVFEFWLEGKKLSSQKFIVN